MINISLCPLPSRVRVHANAHAQKEIILLVFMHILYTHSLWWHMPPPCPRSMLRRPSGWLADRLFEIVHVTLCCHSKGTSVLLSTSPSLSPFLRCSLRMSPAASLADHIKKVIKEDFLAGETSLCAAFRIFWWSAEEQATRMLVEADRWPQTSLPSDIIALDCLHYTFLKEKEEML